MRHSFSDVERSVYFNELINGYFGLVAILAVFGTFQAIKEKNLLSVVFNLLSRCIRMVRHHDDCSQRLPTKITFVFRQKKSSLFGDCSFCLLLLIELKKPLLADL